MQIFTDKQSQIKDGSLRAGYNARGVKQTACRAQSVTILRMVFPFPTFQQDIKKAENLATLNASEEVRQNTLRFAFYLLFVLPRPNRGKRSATLKPVFLSMVD